MKPPPLPSFHALSQNFISVLFKIGSVHALPFENKSEFKLPLAFGKERAPLRLLLDFFLWTALADGLASFFSK